MEPLRGNGRDMPYQTGYETPRPTCLDRMRQWLESAMREWRILGIFLLLSVVCILLSDLDLSVQWKLMSEEKMHLSYPLLKQAFEEQPSFFSLYTMPGDAQTLVLELPKAFFNTTSGDPRPIIFSATYARAAWDDESSLLLLHEPAETTDHVVFAFNVTADGTGVDVVRQQYGVRTSSPDDILSVQLGALSARVATLPVLIDHHHGDAPSFVVDASELVAQGFFITDVAAAQDVRLRTDLCRAFPTNMDITAEYLLPVDPEDPASPLVNEMISFSMALLPEEPMVARALDERIGFFSIHYQDIGDHRRDPNVTAAHKHLSDRVDTRVKIINRRRLEAGPEMKPIIYYIDPTVPPQWRDAFKAGVEAWQPAFEKAGFGAKAIRAVLPGEADWPEDYQVGDLRYSTISWVVDLDTTFALGPSVVDPRSGEILKSDIIFTHGWVKHWISYLENLDPSKDPRPAGGVAPAAGLRALDPAQEARELREVLGLEGSGVAADPFHHHHGHDHDHDHDHGHGSLTLAGRKKPKARAGSAAASVRHAHRHGRCMEARAKFDLSPKLARLAQELTDAEGFVADDILRQGMKEVIMHEVGHTLGLRHNFKASTGVTWAQTQDRAYTQEHGLSISVMDYLPLNVVSGRGADVKVDYFTPTIGTYDLLAIQYGYGVVPGEKPGMPHPVLTALADRNLLFATDEDDASNLGPDPFVTVFDFTSDPAKFYLDRLDLVAELRPTLLDRAVFAGDEFTRFAAAETTLMKAVLNAATSLTKFIGGYTVNRARRAAPGVAQPPPLAVLDPEDQQAALDGILRVLTDDAGLILPQADAVPYMLEKGGSCSGFYQYCLARSPVDLLKAIEDGRQAILTALFAPARLERLRTADWVLKSKAPAAGGAEPASFGVGDLLTATTTALFGAAPATGPRAADSRNWNLQIYYVELLLELAGSQPEELSRELAALASAQLFVLQEAMEGALDAGTVTKASKSYPLLRTVLVKLRERSFLKGDM